MPPGSTNLGIGISMFLRDEFSGPAAKIRSSAASMKKTTQELYDDQLRYTRNLSAGLAMIGAASLAGLGSAIKKGAEFQYQMKFTGIVTNATAVENQKLIKLAQQLSTQYMFSAEQIAAGMKEMGKAGMGVTETMTNIKSAIELAISTDTELAASTDMMIAIMRQWRLGFEDSARIANMMSYAVNASVIDMPDLAEAMKYAGATAIDTGVKIEEVTAMIMALGQAGMKGSMAGVAVENALRYMGRAVGKYGTGQQKKALADINMGLEDFVDSAGNMKPMVEVFASMRKAMDETFGPDMGVEKQNLLNAIFGVRGKRSASLLLRNLDQLEQYVGEINTKSADFASKTTADLMGQLHAQMKMTANAWKIMGQNLAEAISPMLTGILSVVKYIGQGLGWIFDIPLIGKFLAGGIVGFLTIKTVAMAFKVVTSGLLLMYRQLTGSAITMASTTIAGFKGMTSAAAGYAAATTAARSAETAAILSRMGFMGVGRSKVVYNQAAGRFMRSSGAARGAGTFVAGGVAARYAAMYGGRAAMGVAAGGMLGRLVGILGGPWGMALSFGIPALVNVIMSLIRGSRENKHSTDQNTSALEKNTNQSLASLANDRSVKIAAVEYIWKNQGRIGDMSKLAIPGSERPAMDASYMDKLQELVQSMITTQGEPVTVILNVDGTQVAKAMFTKGMRGKLIQQ